MICASTYVESTIIIKINRMKNELKELKDSNCTCQSCECTKCNCKGQCDVNCTCEKCECSKCDDSCCQ